MNTILIVEDSRDVNLMLVEALTDADYQVQSAYTGIEGLDEIKNNMYKSVWQGKSADLP